MATPQPALRATAADHRHAADETCPYCEQSIPNDRAEEIRARFAFKQKQDEAAMKARVDEQVATAREQLELEKKAAIERERAETLTKVNAAREEARQAADVEAKKQIATAQAAHEADKKKLQEAEQQKAEAVNQYQALKAQTETIAAARAAEVRQALEKDNAEKMKAKDAEHGAAIQKLSDQLAAAQRELANVEGEGEDVDLLEELKEVFPHDEIVAVNKKDGATIIHAVKHNRKVCGKIVYDSRNRKIWQDRFAHALHDDMVNAQAMHGIIITTKFPKGAQLVHKVDGVLLVRPACAVVIAEVLREEVIRNFSQRVSDEDRSKKTSKLYDFITSEQFVNVLESLDANVDKLVEIEEEDRKRHKKASESRERLYMGSRRLHAKLRMDVARIVGTADSE